MLTSDDIKQTLKASRVVDLNLSAIHGPLGLEHLSAVVEDLRSRPAATTTSGGDSLTIELRPETRQRLESLVTSQNELSKKKVSAAELAAAIIERVVTAGGQ